MWTKELFGTDKPVIGMMHIKALPTDPKWDEAGGMEAVMERARHDLHALQNGGIDGVLFTNEFSIPYTRNIRPVIVACLADIIGELKDEIKVPFGVNIAGSAYKALDLAAATEAQFIRGTFNGVYVSDSGISVNNLGEMMRHRKELGLDKLRILATVVPEGAKALVEKDVEKTVKALDFSLAPDAMLVFGKAAGSEVDYSLVERAKSVTETPVMISNGVKPDTVVKSLQISDGCIVGTGIKYNGSFYDAVDEERVKVLMDRAREFRGD